MNIIEAFKRCPPGYSIKDRRSGWNEYHVQYGRNEKGELYWTAGMTVGGILNPTDVTVARYKGDDYEVYVWGQREPATILPTFEQAYAEIAKNSVETHGKNLVGKIHSTVTERMNASIASGVDPMVAKDLVMGTTRDILGILDTKAEVNHVYRIARNKYNAPNMAGGLLAMFDEING